MQKALEMLPTPRTDRVRGKQDDSIILNKTCAAHLGEGLRRLGPLLLPQLLSLLLLYLYRLLLRLLSLGLRLLLPLPRLRLLLRLLLLLLLLSRDRDLLPRDSRRW